MYQTWRAKNYVVMTFHRPANVDVPEKLRKIVNTVLNNVEGVPVIFSMRCRTAKVFTDLNIVGDNMHIVDRMEYLEFNHLVKNSKAVATDSGGITKKATVLGWNTSL